MKLRSLIFPLLAITFSFSDPCTPADPTKPPQKKEEPPLEVEAVYPRFQESSRAVSSVGRFTVSDRLAVKAEFNGTIAKVYVGEGDQVNVGDPLCLFKSDDLNRDIEKKQAELKEAQAALDLDRKRLMGESANPAPGTPPSDSHFLDEDNPEKPVPSPLSPSLAPPQPVGDPESLVNLDEAKVERITLELSALEDTSKKLTVTSSIAGLVAKREVTDGRIVVAGDLLFEVVTANPISLTAGVSQDVSSFIDKQTPVKVQPLSLSDVILDGAIYYVSPEIDLSSRTLEIRAHFPNEGGRIKEGDQGKIFVSTRKIEKLLVVPRKVVVESPEGNFIFAIQMEKAVKIPVTLGQEMGNSEVEIVANIRIDDPIILSGQVALKDGSPVSVVINPPALNPVP